MMIRNFLLFATLVLAPLSFGQNTPPTAQLVLPKNAAVGKAVKGTIKLVFAPGLHGYQNPPTKDYMIPVKVESAIKGVTIKVSYPKGMMGEIAGEQAAVYEGAVEIPVEITLPKKPGNVKVSLKISYQQCTHETCFPPDSLTVNGTVAVKKAAKTK